MEKISLSPLEKEVLAKLLMRVTKGEETPAKGVGLSCDCCGKEIVEGEKYFVSEESIASIKLEKGEMTETKEKAWQDTMLCMDCYRDPKEEKDCEGTVDIGVTGHYRDVKRDDEDE